jgi:protein O-mannosyl-transferase
MNLDHDPAGIASGKNGLAAYLKRYRLLILILFGVVLNINTLFNSFAVDDNIVLTNNSYVQQGIKGIPDIFLKEYFSGCKDVDPSVITGGRYRPLTLVLFAFEYQVFGINAFASHLVNVLLFAVLLILIFGFAERHLFRGQDWRLAFFTCLLFAAHPVHVEVVANIKGCDEILAFIMGILTLLTFLRYWDTRKMSMLIVSIFFFLLALLSKETSVSLLAVMVLLLVFFKQTDLKKAVFAIWPFLPVFIGYLVLRYLIVGFVSSNTKLVLASPFLYASPAQAFATKVWVQLKYILLLFFPHPLSSEYSYRQIPYVGLLSIEFVLASIVLISLIVYSITVITRRPVISFSILYYFASIFLLSNFLVPVGTPMAERFLFQPSLAFCLIVASLLVDLGRKQKYLGGILLSVILLLFSAKTYSRNADWKDTATLNFRDIRYYPENMKLNQYAAEHYYFLADRENDKGLKRQYVDSALKYAAKACSIDSLSPVPWVELGAISMIAKDYHKAAEYWLGAYRLMPEYPELKGWMNMLAGMLFREGNSLYELNEIEKAVISYHESVMLDPAFLGSWAQLSYCYDRLNDSTMSAMAWQKVMALDPRMIKRPVRDQE